MKLDKPLSIIIADDDQDDQYFFKQALDESLLKHEAVAVENGSELMRLLLRNKDSEGAKPDIIFLDINMPAVNGFEALQLIKQDQFLKTIPVYMFSTSSSSGDIAKALNLGAEGYYVKTTKFQDLIQLVKNICSRWVSNPNLKYY